MSKTARIGAAVLLAAPLAALIGNVVLPTVSDDAPDRLAALTDHPTPMAIGMTVGAISIALMIGGIIWLAGALRSSAYRLALTGGVLGVLGCLVVLFVDGMAAAGPAIVNTLGTAQAGTVLIWGFLRSRGRVRRSLWPSPEGPPRAVDAGGDERVDVDAWSLSYARVGCRRTGCSAGAGPRV